MHCILRTRMVECGKEREQNPGVHDALAEACWNYVCRVLPPSVVELQ